MVNTCGCESGYGELPPLPELRQMLLAMRPGQVVTITRNGAEWYHGEPDDEYQLSGWLETTVNQIRVQDGCICFDLEWEGDE